VAGCLLCRLIAVVYKAGKVVQSVLTLPVSLGSKIIPNVSFFLFSPSLLTTRNFV
jgi:hypothetical protein